MALRAHSVNSVGRVSSNIKIPIGVKSQAIWDPTKSVNEHLRAAAATVGIDLQPNYAIEIAFGYIEEAFLCVQSDAIRKMKWAVRKGVNSSVGRCAVDDPIAFFPCAGIT